MSKKCHVHPVYGDLNPPPSECESPPITTRPWLPPKELFWPNWSSGQVTCHLLRWSEFKYCRLVSTVFLLNITYLLMVTSKTTKSSLSAVSELKLNAVKMLSKCCHLEQRLLKIEQSVKTYFIIHCITKMDAFLLASKSWASKCMRDLHLKSVFKGFC